MKDVTRLFQMQNERSGAKPLNPTAEYVVVYAPAESTSMRSPSVNARGMR